MRPRSLLLGAAGLVLMAAPAAGAALPAPSLSLSAAFSPPTGVARADFGEGTSGTARATAIDGGRIYAVGQSATGTGGDTAILARRLDGALDTGFSEDGRLVLPIAPAGTEDAGVDIVVLPDRRIRVLVAMGSAATRSGAVVGLNPDGSADAAFGSADGTADGIVALGQAPQQPAALAAGPGDVLAIAGSDAQSGNDDAFVTLLDGSGVPVPTFGAAGTVRSDRSGSGAPDAGVDVAFRPDSGPLVLERIGPEASVTVALHALRMDGTDDTGFAGSGDLRPAIGEAPTAPMALALDGGRIWITGSTRSGVDTNAFLARVEGDGSGLQSRQFDMRGRAADPAQAVTSQGSSVVVSPAHEGIPKTVVVGGLVTTSSSTDWAAAAFNGADGPLDAAGYGDIVITAPGVGGLSSVAAAGDGGVIATGPFQETVSGSTYFRVGQARLLIDAEKACNLRLSVAAPLELAMSPFALGDVSLKVENAGSRACGGSIAPAEPYSLSRDGTTGPVAVAPVAPGESATVDARLGRQGPLIAQDSVVFTLTAAADASTTDNKATLRVRFRYCGAALTPAGGRAFLPSEGAARLSFSVRNTGTVACSGARIRVGGEGRRQGRGGRFAVAPGSGASDDVRVRVRPGKAGRRAVVRFRLAVPGDATSGDDVVRVRRRVLAVGDTDFAPVGAAPAMLDGFAVPGRGSSKRSLVRVTRVDVAVRRLGAGCRWLARDGGFRSRPPGAKGSCPRPVWLRAAGTRRWSLATGSLPPGRYEALSRATIGAGFREARFGARDGNRVTFRTG